MRLLNLFMLVCLFFYGTVVEAVYEKAIRAGVGPEVKV